MGRGEADGGPADDCPPAASVPKCGACVESTDGAPRLKAETENYRPASTFYLELEL